MRIVLVCLFVTACVAGAHAQSGITLSKQKSSSPDHVQGKVLVKIKEEYRSLFQNGTAARMSSSLQGATLRPLARQPFARKQKNGRAQAFKPVVDISLYYEITYDPSRPVDQVIRDLYNGGQIEKAEPVYREQMMYTPSDPAKSSQYYLEKIKAYEAWDITQGSEDIVIAIIDSGGDLDHPDLANQLYINEAEFPANGVDDDHNGYIDDYCGWDFSGADTLDASDPNFAGDNDPSIYKSGPGFVHGTAVGSCASASTDDGVGMAGVGFRTKLLFTKHYSDNQKASSLNYTSNLYSGVLYAAHQGAKVINCSWGSTVRSEIYQDIITYVTMDLGCLVVGAAGNSNNGTPIYPASYDYAVSVAATDSNDKRAGFSSYGSTVDLSAPGVNIYFATFDNAYQTDQGTSFSAPIVSGAAALVWAQHPEFTPLQVAEQLRVTADASMYDVNQDFLGKLGKGRLNIYRALTQELPSIRAHHAKFVNGAGTTPLPGEMAYLSFDFTNYLNASSSGLMILVSTTSPYIEMVDDNIRPGSIATGGTVNNASEPFELQLSESIPENEEIELEIRYSDGAYQDVQSFTIIPNPTFLTVDDNRITTTLSAEGRLGFEDTEGQTHGKGFIFDEQSLLYEMGPVMGSSSSTILNTVRGISGLYDQDFVSLSRIGEIVPGERSYAEISGAFSNAIDEAQQKVVVTYRSLVWKESPYDKFVIIEYKVRNPQATMLNDFRFGLFADWDISTLDTASWNQDNRIGYIFSNAPGAPAHAGIQVLNHPGAVYNIDNHPTIAGSSVGLYDGFTDDEKFRSLSEERLHAGPTQFGVSDVSHVVSAGPFNIEAGAEITIAFALHAAGSLPDLLTSARYADSLYNFTLAAPRPIVAEKATCYGATTTISASGASSFKWYRDFTGGAVLGEGNEFTVPDLKNDTTFYVSNADHSYESVRTPVFIDVQARPVITASRSTDICAGEQVTLSVDEATEYLWSNDATTQSVDVGEAGNYSVITKYNNDTLQCESVSEVVTVTVRPKPQAAFSQDVEEPEPGVQLQFSDESTGAVEWFWQFGDDATSTDQHPTHTYDMDGSYDVTLTVTATNGCQDEIQKTLPIVTGVEDFFERAVGVYPAPVTSGEMIVAVEDLPAGNLNLQLISAQGKQMMIRDLKMDQAKFTYPVDVRSYAAGLYLLKVRWQNNVVVRKVIITR